MGKAVLLVALFALLIYASLRLIERRRVGRPRPVDPPVTRRSLAPDDDPDFLRDLERRRREQQRQQPDEPEA